MIKILVVEDERAISDLIRMNLEDAGYACTCVYDGMAVADQIETQTFDLVYWISCCRRQMDMSC